MTVEQDQQGSHDRCLLLQANAEKLRLEMKQRAARKAAERGDPIRPRWFTRVEGAVPGKQQAYSYHGGYFEAREAGQWPGVRDIFGPGLPTESPSSYPSSPTAARATSYQGSPGST